MQRRPRVHAANHLQFIRELPCLICGNNIETQAAHIRYGDPRIAKPKVGIGEKPDDKFTVPLCGKDHARQHSMNEKAFWEMAGIDPVLVALALWSVTGDFEAGEQIVSAHAPPPDLGAGAPDLLTKISNKIKAHFDTRWGQGAPVLEAEATLLAGELLTTLRNFRQMPD